MSYAPIALFVYNRPWHTRQTVEALLLNPAAAETQLYVFSDAADGPATVKNVDEVREYVRGLEGFKSVSLVEKDRNYGLADSIVDGVSRVCDQHGRVIVMEDDLVTSPYFLEYMNQGLEKYQDEENVISIHGYVYPIEQSLPETFFLKAADCWGWATWQRGWNLYEADGQKLLDQLESRGLTRKFDFDGSYPYTRMLQKQIEGKNKSWAIRWYASAFLKDRLTLYPGRSLVHNIGLDASGEHCSSTEDFSGPIASARVMLEDIAIGESQSARNLFVDFHKRTRSSLLRRVAKKVLFHLQRMRIISHGK